MKSKHLKNKTVIVVGGPTASGKSKLAIDLAKNLRGEIINGDSMQVYKNFKILTSQPHLKDMKKIKHHLYGFVNTTVNFNAVQWLKSAKNAIDGILFRNKVPIVVGGSGLYLEFLLRGINNIPSISDNTKLKVKKIIDHNKKKEVFELVKQIDPQYALKIDQADKFRISKVLETFYETNKNISYFYQQKRNLNGYSYFKILNLPQKKIVNKSIEKRLGLMINEGLVEEIKTNRIKVEKCNIEKAIGYSEINNFLNEKISLDQAKKLIIKNTKSFAKRQYTWFKNRFDENIRLESNPNISLIVETFLKIN